MKVWAVLAGWVALLGVVFPSALVLASYALDEVSWRMWKGDTPMALNTAICFLCTGFGLMALGMICGHLIDQERKR